MPLSYFVLYWTPYKLSLWDYILWILIFYCFNLLGESKFNALPAKEEAVCQWLCFNSQIKPHLSMIQNAKSIEGNTSIQSIYLTFHISIKFWFQICWFSFFSFLLFHVMRYPQPAFSLCHLCRLQPTYLEACSIT